MRGRYVVIGSIVVLAVTSIIGAVLAYRWETTRRAPEASARPIRDEAKHDAVPRPAGANEPLRGPLARHEAGGPITASDGPLLPATERNTASVPRGGAAAPIGVAFPPLAASMRPVAPDDVLADGISREAVAKLFNARRETLVACYRAALEHAPSLAGRVVLEVDLQAGGRIESVEIDEDTIGDSSVASCLRSRVRTWHFPSGTGTGTFTCSVVFASH